jgi:hypothetical protein
MLKDKPKPRLTARGVAALLAMHDGIDDMDMGDRAELMRQHLCCYSEGWKLTRQGKSIARYLTRRL